MGFFDNKVVTVFNQSINGEMGECVYFPTLLQNVDIVVKCSKTATKDGHQDADVVTLYVEDVENYKKPKEWENLEDAEKKQCFTFAPRKDFFVKGNCLDGYSGQSYEEMRARYDDCYIVESVSIYEDVLPHMEIGGK